MTSRVEAPLSLTNGPASLRGILHRPSTDERHGPVVVFLPGWSGCRLGPHRHFVKAARRLADRGIASLRFDYRGRGESDGSAADTTIATMVEDTGTILTWVGEMLPQAPILLAGICSGAKVAIMTAAQHPNLAGLALWSAEPMGHLVGSSRTSRKRLHVLKAYMRKAFAPATWRKLVRGEVNTHMVGAAIRQDEKASSPEQAAEDRALLGFRDFQGPVLYVYGERDPETPLALKAYQAFCARHRISSEFVEIPEADHSFYNLEQEAQVMDITEWWIDEYVSPQPRRAS